jgi:hypothetical protein
MKNGTGVQAILEYHIRNLRVCNASIDGGRDLRITPSRLVRQSLKKIGSAIQ